MALQFHPKSESQQLAELRTAVGKLVQIVHVNQPRPTYGVMHALSSLFTECSHPMCEEFSRLLDDYD